MAKATPVGAYMRHASFSANLKVLSKQAIKKLEKVSPKQRPQAYFS